MPKEDYYKILGVSENANADEIKKAYRKLAKDNHPDTHPGDERAEKKFKAISEAYSVLGDPKRREQYDQMRKYGFNGSQGGGYQGQGVHVDLSDLFGGFSRSGGQRGRRGSGINSEEFFGFGGLGDLFSQMFEGGGQGFSPAGTESRRGADIEADLQIPFNTAVFGGKTTFSISKEIECPACSGSGAKKGKQPEVCGNCHGAGMVSQSQGGFAVSRPCPVCMGKGKIISDPCDRCNGRGQVQGQRKYTIKVSPGTNSGKKVRLRGQGSPGVDGQPAGDLIINLKVQKHRFFRNEGLDIYCEVPVDKKRVKKGTRVKVKTIHGNPVVVKVPPKTEDGKTFRLKGMGVKTQNETGDQYVKIRVR